MVRINLARPHGPSQVVQVAAGVDTLHIFTRAPVRGPALERLLQERALAEEAGEPRPVQVAALDFEVAPWKLRRGAALLESDFYAVKVQPAARFPEATVTVEVRSLALWGRGWREAARAAVEVMGALTVGQLEVQVSRIDVTVDFQGWAPAELDARRFHTRARARGKFRQGKPGAQWDDAATLEAERRRALSLMEQVRDAADLDALRLTLERLHHLQPELEADYNSGRAFSGFAWGRGGAVSGRLYNKTLELRSSGAGHMRAVWRRCRDYRAAQDVWRMEFQFRREALRQLEGVADDCGEWVTCAEHLPALWAYGTRSWLWHGRRTAKVRRGYSPVWEQLQGADWREAAPAPVKWATDLTRVVMDGALRPVAAATAGYLTTAAAQQLDQLGADAPKDAAGWSALLGQVVLAAYERAKLPVDATTPGGLPALQARVQAKREAMRARRAHLATRAERRRGMAPAVGAPHGPRQAGETPQRYAWLHEALVLQGPHHDELEAAARLWQAEADRARRLEAEEARDDARREAEALDRKWCVEELG